MIELNKMGGYSSVTFWAYLLNNRAFSTCCIMCLALQKVHKYVNLFNAEMNYIYM